MLSAEISMDRHHAHAYRVTSALHQTADPNVLLILTALQVKHVLMKNVKTHVWELVALTRNAMFKTIFQHVVVDQASRVILSHNVLK